MPAVDRLHRRTRHFRVSPEWGIRGSQVVMMGLVTVRPIMVRYTRAVVVTRIRMRIFCELVVMFMLMMPFGMGMFEQHGGAPVGKRAAKQGNHQQPAAKAGASAVDFLRMHKLSVRVFREAAFGKVLFGGKSDDERQFAVLSNEFSELNSVCGTSSSEPQGLPI
jgi:hypothetical protein